MAKGYLEKRLKELGRNDIEVSSTGLIPLVGMEATEEARQVAKEDGIDLSSHRTRTLTEAEIQKQDLIFVMERQHKEYIISKYPEVRSKLYLLKDFKKIGNFDTSENPDIEDPIAKDVDFYKKTFAVIKESIERILKEIN